MEENIAVEISEELYNKIAAYIEKQGLTMEEFLLGAVKRKLEE